jgi:L-aspartate semialdehyde sulfurtransferase ferredoxin
MNKYVLNFPQDIVENPILSETILETGVLMNIIRARVDYNEGTVVVSIPGNEETQKKVVELLKRKGVEVSRLKKSIVNEEEKCVSCGACISVCPAGAISFNKNKEIEIEKDRCHRCGVCVEACPRRSLSIQQLE